MIYDCFYFFDELDLLEIRLNILNDFVDYFVISESNESFNGNKKELYFNQNRNKFKKFENKIIYNLVDDFPNNKEILNKAYNSPNTGNKAHWWIREFYQKELIIKSLQNCVDDDIIFLSDLDEIWNPELLPIEIEDDKVYRPIQKAYPFYLNTKSDQPYSDWTGTRICNFKTFKKYGANHVRTEREITGIPINNGGWHFSWLGQNSSDKWNDNHPDNIIRYNIVKKYNIKIETNELPDYLKLNKEKWKRYFKE